MGNMQGNPMLEGMQSSSRLNWQRGEKRADEAGGNSTRGLCLTIVMSTSYNQPLLHPSSTRLFVVVRTASSWADLGEPFQYFDDVSDVGGAALFVDGRLQWSP